MLKEVFSNEQFSATYCTDKLLGAVRRRIGGAIVPDTLEQSPDQTLSTEKAGVEVTQMFSPINTNYWDKHPRAHIYTTVTDVSGRNSTTRAFRIYETTDTATGETTTDIAPISRDPIGSFRAARFIKRVIELDQREEHS